MGHLPDPASLLPLPAATFHILMAVCDADRHGYAIIQDVEARTNGELKLSAGTLYRSIQRMLEQGLLIETRDRPSPEDDDERRHHQIVIAVLRLRFWSIHWFGDAPPLRIGGEREKRG